LGEGGKVRVRDEISAQVAFDEEMSEDVAMTRPGAGSMPDPYPASPRRSSTPPLESSGSQWRGGE